VSQSNDSSSASSPPSGAVEGAMATAGRGGE
jgi:hypothetical protein